MEPKNGVWRSFFQRNFFRPQMASGVVLGSFRSLFPIFTPPGPKFESSIVLVLPGVPPTAARPSTVRTFIAVPEGTTGAAPHPNSPSQRYFPSQIYIFYYGEGPFKGGGGWQNYVAKSTVRRRFHTSPSSILRYITKNRRNIILTQMGGVYTFWMSKISTNNFHFSQNLYIYVFMLQKRFFQLK